MTDMQRAAFKFILADGKTEDRVMHLVMLYAKRLVFDKLERER
jgi:hypothetical protein